MSDLRKKLKLVNGGKQDDDNNDFSEILELFRILKKWKDELDTSNRKVSNRGFEN